MPTPLRPTPPLPLHRMLEPLRSRSLHQQGGQLVYAEARREGELRVVDQWSLHPLRALDRTVFRIGEDLCVEAARYTSQDGPNLHPQPIPIPTRFPPDLAVELLPNSWAKLVFSGEVEHRGERFGALAIETWQGGEARVLWVAEGIGELSLVAGPFARPGPILRELIAWTDGEITRLGPVPELPGLPGLPPVARGGGAPKGIY